MQYAFSLLHLHCAGYTVCVLAAVTSRTSPVTRRACCWWPAALCGNSVSGTQSLLCSSSTLACCDCGSLNRGPVCLSVSGTCVLSLAVLLKIATTTMAPGNAWLEKRRGKKWPQMISRYSLWITLRQILFSIDGREAEYLRGLFAGAVNLFHPFMRTLDGFRLQTE